MLPPTSLPGAEFTIEPFRWDQRLFSILLKSAASSVDAPGSFSSPSEMTPNSPLGQITAMSEVTGTCKMLSCCCPRHFKQALSITRRKVLCGIVYENAFAVRRVSSK